MKILRIVITLLVLLAMTSAGVLFAAANDAPVPLDLLFYTFSPQSLALWVLAAFALGGVVGMLVSSALMLRMRTALGSSKRQLNKTREELNQLRAQGPATQ